VIDLNHIFLFIALISPLAVLGRAWAPGGTSRGWSVAALTVLAITGVAWVFFRKYAGYVGGGAWMVLLFIPAVGLRRVAELAAMHRYRSARKLGRILLLFHPSRELREQIELFRMLATRQAAGLISVPPAHAASLFSRPLQRLRSAPVVTTLIILNIAVFALELGFGLRTNLDVLRRLGALEVFAVVMNHQYWRVLTALFLHYNFIHLLLNLFAFYILGPPLERSIGWLRFAACYLISGIGSSLGVIALTLLRVIPPAELVGASGCVMGIVGAWAGFLLRHRHIPQARQRLTNIIMIILVQFVFDISTPQVSTSAHLCGLATGFLVGLLVAGQPRSAREP
jgi:membrane associated rhomboid family serine protease